MKFRLFIRSFVAPRVPITFRYFIYFSTEHCVAYPVQRIKTHQHHHVIAIHTFLMVAEIHFMDNVRMRRHHHHQHHRYMQWRYM